MVGFLRRMMESWRTSGKELEARTIENAQVAHEAAEHEKHRETGLPPGRTNTDWTYVPPG